MAVPLAPPELVFAVLLPGVVLEVLLLVLGELLDEPLVPVAPMEDVELGEELLPLAVVSVLVDELPVVVLGEVLPLMPPEPVAEPVVVDGDVVLLPGVVDDDVPDVPLEPVVLASPAGLLQALSERAAAIATAATVNWVFIRNS